MNKKIFHYSDIEDKIIHAVDTINDPVRQTLSPKGGNCIYEDDNGNQHYTNDGVTIMNNISVADEVENAIIEIIKGGARQTNIEAGDGTSSTCIMSSVLIKEGLRMIRDGVNQMDLRDGLIKFAEDLKAELKKKVTLVKNDEEIKKIANISANNDEDIARNIVKIIKIVGQDGQVLIDGGFNIKTELIEDTGFILKSGLFTQELANKEFKSLMLDVPVLITDKRIYYKAEAESILSTVIDAGYNEVVIIAQDFIGESLSYFVANHRNSGVRIILVAEKKIDILEDLAVYLGTEVVSDKKGMLVNNININQFAMAKRVFSNPAKTIISRDKKESMSGIKKRVSGLKAELKKIGNKNDPDYKKLEMRISSLTNGMVTIKVGGDTPLEIAERCHRYEDAINAARVALKEGYLPGAGVAIYNAFLNIQDSVNDNYHRMFLAVAEANIRQIAENCGRNPDLILEKILVAPRSHGYNALTNKIEDVVKAGIIEPYIVTSQVISNAVSIANVILTSRYIIINDLEELRNKEK